MSALDLDGLLSVPGAAALLHVSEAAVRAWLSRGKLRRIKAGRRTLVERSALLALLQVQPVHDAAAVVEARDLVGKLESAQAVLA